MAQLEDLSEHRMQQSKPNVLPESLSGVFALEGDIGSGKSTLAGKIGTTFPEVAVYEEQANEGFLKLFYNNPSKYGFALQWGMLKTRKYQLALAQHDAKTRPFYKDRRLFVWDRSMIGDYIFALWNHLSGSISMEEMEVYESEFGGGLNNLESIGFLNDIKMFVLLNDTPARCKHRVEQIRKNESEQGIPLSYYEGIDDIHFTMFCRLIELRRSKVAVLNWGQYEDPASVIARINAEASCGRITRTQTLKEASKIAEPACIYRTAMGILEAFSAIEAGATPSPSVVFIPDNIMTIDPADKGVSKTHKYAITFYENAYKRVVLYHLSTGCHVVFYKI